MAILIILSLVLSVFPVSVENKAAETVDSTEEESGTQEESILMQENSSQFEQDVIRELDANNKDEYGCTYTLNENYKTATLISTSLSCYDATGEYIEVRVPEKVGKDAVEYKVTAVYYKTNTFADRIDCKVKYYIGKNVKSLSMSEGTCNIVIYFVHPDNDYFCSEEGTLFDKEKKTLVYFYDGIYTHDSIYHVPDTVTTIGRHSFWGTVIKEVILADSVTKIDSGAFWQCRIQRIDLNNVKVVFETAFGNCNRLKEVIVREEGVQLYDECFFDCDNLEYIYLPANTKVIGNCFKWCDKLKMVIMSEGCTLLKCSRGEQETFSKCYNMQILILPTSLTELVGDAINECNYLGKLYLPSTLASMTDCSAVTGIAPLTLYSEDAESPAKEYAEQYEGVQFSSLEGHEHHLEDVTFFSFSQWAVTGKYCEDCGYSEEVRRITWEDESEKEELPPLWERQEETCPECVDLNEENTDDMGILYELDHTDMTASIKKVERPIDHNGRWYLPARVKKDGQIYTVDTIQSHAFGKGSFIGVVLPDTIKILESSCFYGQRLEFIVMGSGVEKIGTSNIIAPYGIGRIEVSQDNPYFCSEDNVWYTKDKSELIYMGQDGVGTEYTFTVPLSVKKILRTAFHSLYKRDGYLEKIQIYNKDDIDIQDKAFYGVDLDIEYLECGQSLDENNRDDEGRRYKLYDVAKKATFIPDDLSIYDGKELELPNRVQKNGIVYKVNRIEFDEVEVENTQEITLNIGKYIESISFGKVDHSLIYCNVESENTYFYSYRGSLFSPSRDTLYYFYDGVYDSGAVYYLPSLVETIASGAFCGADISKVVTGDLLTLVETGAFEDSQIQRIDLENVEHVGDDAFKNCKNLEEVKFSTSGLQIGDNAFYGCYRLKSVYCPKNTTLGAGAFCECRNLETVVLDEGINTVSRSSFSYCFELHTLLLSEGMEKLSELALFSCQSLEKLYIPESVNEMVQGCMYRDTTILYGNKDSVAKDYDDETGKNITFQSLEEHTHDLKEVTFFLYDTWGVKGKYCEECAYGSDYEIVEFESDEDREQMPELLNITGRACPEVSELDDDNMDDQLVVYELDDSGLTATVVGIKVLYNDNNTKISNGYIAIPERVSKHGKEYVVDAVDTVYGADSILLPDTVKRFRDGGGDGEYLNYLQIGSGVESISLDNRRIFRLDVSKENPYFINDNGVLYDKGKETLYKYSAFETEQNVTYNIPDTIECILNRVFPYLSDTSLKEINVYMKSGMNICENAFEGCEGITIHFIGSSEETSSPSPFPTPTPPPANTTEEPETTQTEEPSRQIPAADTPAPQLPPVAEAAQVTQLKENDLFITGFRVVSNYNKSVKICWKRNVNAVYYRIYRAQKRNGTYKLIQVVSGSKTNYIDKKAKSLKTYFYRMSAVGNGGGAAVEGERSSVRSICISGIGAPKVRVKKGKIDLVRYITVTLKHYDGKYADIYISLGGKKFSKLKLVSNRISKYKGNFKIRYMVKNKMIRLKVRTYKKKGKKKVYGAFSKVARIKV